MSETVSLSHMPAAITAIAHYLPESIVSTEQLAAEFPDWSVEKIEEKTGIHARHIAAPEQCSSDLACEAAAQLFDSRACRPSEVDFILLCTQSPDYFLPTTACILQHRLGIPVTAGALDFNLGCSGYIYGLSLAKGLIETEQARCVLLLTAETYSKFLHPQDKSVRTIFGDAAAATLVRAVDHPGRPPIGPFVFGTDGSGAKNLIVPTGAARQPRTVESGIAVADESGNWRSQDDLYMNGAEIFAFTMREVPKCAQELLTRAGMTAGDVDLFVFHQANRFMLEHLRKKMRIPEEKFLLAFSECGNTVSSTIPIALSEAQKQGRIKPGSVVALVGFGVGYSWGAAMITWI